MKKTILITGSTDGIGLAAAKMLADEGHKILLHGRSPKKLVDAQKEVGGDVEGYLADLSNLTEIEFLAKELAKKHAKLDVLINNAGVYKAATPITQDSLDIRFVVNAIAPYYLTKLLVPLFDTSSRVINLSSAAQASVSIDALMGKVSLSDGEVYAQSKLALTMVTFIMAQNLNKKLSSLIAVNPASLLGTKMVKEGYGISGKDISIGSGILTRMALSDDFSNIIGRYFDNDIGEFTSPHPNALNLQKCEEVVSAIETILDEKK